ncbi:MAG: RNase adapter RapZ [Pyrinomonadaceae bacterium]
MAAKRKQKKRERSRLIIITGLSGSGMSSATNAFEDLGYFCVDNLPLTILSTFTKLLLPKSDSTPAIEQAALIVDFRERHFLADFADEIERLKRKGLDPFIVFFEASDEVLQRRFSETRRPHPADDGKGLRSAIKKERKTMEPIRKGVDLIVDTSEHTVHTLRRFLLQEFGVDGKSAPLKVQLLSFGHKFGNPRDLDLMFDVRHLPNPYFEPKLRDLSGTDKAVIKYLKDQKEVNETIKRFASLLRYLLPFYEREGKSYLTIGIGCTGGRHRSVMVANEIADDLKRSGSDISIVHRDMQK